MDEWIGRLQRGDPDGAWDLFLGRYRRLVFAAIRHYATDYDDVMDVFARVCEALREDDLRRLRGWAEGTHRARCSTWLVTVVRNLTIDWFRHRDGRRRLSAIADTLPPLQQRIFVSVFVDRRTHLEAFELLRSSQTPDLTFRAFRQELRATYQAVASTRRGALLRDVAGPVEDLPSLNDIEDVHAITEPGYREQVERALGMLDPVERAAVELYVIEELPAADVARITGLPSAKAVYNKVYRTLEVLREHLEKAGVRREDL